MDQKELVKWENEAFEQYVTPKKLNKSAKELFLFRCDCSNLHFRHAGYMEAVMPFVRPDGQKKVSKDSYVVQVCTQCRACYIWLNEQMYDVTEMIDLKAWEKAERELHQATGPGGQC